ncbi:hypothetical protein ZWY2020_008637 [Hordeum vulgare]|nr:hypothetical protein ZWY2020_008637 [Hordeum vulgare]
MPAALAVVYHLGHGWPRMPPDCPVRLSPASLRESPGKGYGEKMPPYCAGKTRNSRQGSYEPPPGASRIIPSGFMNTWEWLESMGHPKPPPLMLELNGRLVRTFEEVFGWLHAWKGYKNFDMLHGHGKNAWRRLDKKIVATISRGVISLVSFNGFLIRGPSRKGCARNVIVTSASLVRTCDVTDKFDENMRVGIGGPLINFFDGCLVGMNFYDGRPDRTPYLPLPCKKIREVLHSTWRLTTDRSVLRLDKPDVNNKCRWPVPKPYWYHGLLEMNRCVPMPMKGWVRQ